MIKHIVMMKFFDEGDGRSKKDNLAIAKSIVDDFVPKIKEIKEMKCGINFYNLDSPKAFDIVLDSIFESIEDIEAYKIHPLHLELVDFLNKVRDTTYYVDYKL